MDKALQEKQSAIVRAQGEVSRPDTEAKPEAHVHSGWRSERPRAGGETSNGLRAGLQLGCRELRRGGGGQGKGTWVSSGTAGGSAVVEETEVKMLA